MLAMYALLSSHTHSSSSDFCHFLVFTVQLSHPWSDCLLLHPVYMYFTTNNVLAILFTIINVGKVPTWLLE